VATPEASIVQEGRATCILLDWGGVTDLAISNPTDSLVPGPVRTDGRMAVVRMAGGEVVSWMLAEGRSLSYKSLDLITLVPAASASLSGQTLQLGRNDAQFVAYGPGITTVLGPDDTPLTFVREGPWVHSLGTSPEGGGKAPRGQHVSGERGRLEIAVDCSPAAGAEIRVTIHDVRGRVIRNLAVPRGGAPGGVLTWDGRNERGTRAAAGVYFARVIGCGRNDVRRVVLVH
jgi:FlgD Ig-like domain